jgi:hypothetical protein
LAGKVCLGLALPFWRFCFGLCLSFWEMSVGYGFLEVDRPRFVHYWQQIDFIRRLKFSSLLVVGPGDFVVVDFFRRNGFDVKTLDYDSSLSPDFLLDLRDVGSLKAHFGVVLASEVLEHLNFEHLPKVLSDLHNLCDFLVVSVPYSYLRLPFGDNGLFKTRIPFFFWSPKKFSDSDFEHHKWSVGFRHYSRARLRRLFLEHFSIVEEKICYDTNCVFWVLKSIP